MGRSLSRFRDRDFACREVRERGIGSVKGEGASLTDGNVNPERPIEIWMQPIQSNESIESLL